MRVESIDETVVRVRISDRLDVGNAKRLQQRADECLKEGKGLLILFEPDAFCDSHGIQAILNLAGHARDRFGEERLAVFSESRAINQVIEITRLARTIPVYDSEEEARHALSEAIAGHASEQDGN